MRQTDHRHRNHLVACGEQRALSDPYAVLQHGRELDVEILAVGVRWVQILHPQMFRQVIVRQTQHASRRQVQIGHAQLHVHRGYIVGRGIEDGGQTGLQLLRPPAFAGDQEAAGQAGQFARKPRLVMCPAARSTAVLETDCTGQTTIHEHRRVQHGGNALLLEIAPGEGGRHRVVACIGCVDHAAAAQCIEIGPEAFCIEHMARRMPVIRRQLLHVIKVETDELMRVGVQIPDACTVDRQRVGGRFGQRSQCTVATGRQCAVGAQAHHGGQLPVLPFQARALLASPTQVIGHIDEGSLDGRLPAPCDLPDHRIERARAAVDARDIKLHRQDASGSELPAVAVAVYHRKIVGSDHAGKRAAVHQVRDGLEAEQLGCTPVCIKRTEAPVDQDALDGAVEQVEQLCLAVPGATRGGRPLVQRDRQRIGHDGHRDDEGLQQHQRAQRRVVAERAEAERRAVEGERVHQDQQQAHPAHLETKGRPDECGRQQEHEWLRPVQYAQEDGAGDRQCQHQPRQRRSDVGGDASQLEPFQPAGDQLHHEQGTGEAGGAVERPVRYVKGRTWLPRQQRAVADRQHQRHAQEPYIVVGAHARKGLHRKAVQHPGARADQQSDQGRRRQCLQRRLASGQCKRQMTEHDCDEMACSGQQNDCERGAKSELDHGRLAIGQFEQRVDQGCQRVDERACRERYDPQQGVGHNGLPAVEVAAC